MKKLRGPSGKARPRPRQPTPTPRTFEIIVSFHAQKRCEEVRGITLEQLRTTLVHGREIITPEVGAEGGFISRFSKTFVSRDSGGPISRTVIAVCEVWPDKCVVVTAYHA